MIICPNLAKCRGIRHGFFTREGGVSKGLYSSLNCGPGSQDMPEYVAENRYIAAQRLEAEPQSLCTLYQVHSKDVITVHTPWPEKNAPKADGMATCTRGITLGILTADCAPVLLADGKAGVIGAAHAGWKGALAGIIEETINTMESLGATRSDITATIGPCIGFTSYEVTPEFKKAFTKQSFFNRRFFKKSDKKGHLLFNLPGYVLSRLHKAGVRDTALLPHDTLTDEKHFFSYRRSCQHGEPDYGRQLSAITLY